VPFRFSLSRPISAEDIRPAIRAQNLNKTNQYSNPPLSLSLADSPSVPFPAFFLVFFTFFFIYFYSSLFPAAFLRLRPPSSSRSLSRLLRSFIHWYNIERLIYSRLFAESGNLLSRPFQPLYSLGFNSPNDWFYTWRTVFVSFAEKKNKYKIKNLYEDNEKK